MQNKICSFLSALLLCFTLVSCEKTEEQTPEEGSEVPSIPEITSISPESGPKGSYVTINGSGFGTSVYENIVKFNGVVAPMASANTSQIRVIVPDDAQTGIVTVTVGDLTVEGPSFTVQEEVVKQAPTITSISPESGLKGTLVTINGANFSTVVSENMVMFNGVEATVASATATKLEVTVPEKAGDGLVTVTVGELSAIGPAFDFLEDLEITSVSPLSGSAETLVKILGEGFSDVASENEVLFNGVAANVVWAQKMYLEVRVPAKAGDGAITISVAGKEFSGPEFDYQEVHTVSTFAGNGEAAYIDGEATNAQFNKPFGLAIDANDNIYVADLANHQIRKITPAGEVSTFAGSGVPGFADGFGSDASFNQPTGITIDANGDFYVTDYNNHRIRKISSTGLVTTFAGNGTSGGMDGKDTGAQFYQPAGLTVGRDGNIYVTEAAGHRIRKITPNAEVTTLAGSGISGSVDGMGVNAQFNDPFGIVADASGNLFVADHGNHRIRKITPAGEVSTLAGNAYGSRDGNGVNASFYYPWGISIGPDGNLYVGEKSNNKIRKITPQAEVTTFAGSGDYGNYDGISTIARFKSPAGIVFDSNGNLFVSDMFNHKIRKIVYE